MKNYYYKRKNLLNHLINCVEELENVCLEKLILKYESILNFKSIKKCRKYIKTIFKFFKI